MAVYAFFLKSFNGKDAAGTVEDLFSKRLQLSDLERSIDQLRSAEHETYAWEKMQDPEHFRARIGPCISKVNGAIRKALGQNSLAAQYQISTGKKYGVKIPKFEIVEEAGKSWQGPQQ
jgi:hypothetical protein